jgi:hypothetical protein
MGRNLGMSTDEDAREAAWGVYRDGPDYQPTDRHDVRSVFDFAFDAGRRSVVSTPSDDVQALIDEARNLATWHLRDHDTDHPELERTPAQQAETLNRLAARLEASAVSAPPTITDELSTVGDLEALPVGSVVRCVHEEIITHADGSWERGAIAEKRLDASGQPSWFMVGKTLGYRSHQADLLPASLLYRPPATALGGDHSTNEQEQP